MALEKLHSLLTVPTYRVEVPEKVTQNGAPATNYKINVDENLTAHRYEGQVALIILDADAGGKDGYFLHVVDNEGGAGTSTVTFEEDISSILEDNDEIAITTIGQPPQDAAGGVTSYFGVFKSNKIPHFNRKLFDGYYHGSDNLPGAEEFINILNEYGESLELFVKNAEILGLALGEVEEVTADFDALDPAQALAAVDHYPGDDYLTMAAAADARFTDGKIIFIESTSGKSEVAKINGAPVGAEIHLTHPLKNFHDASDVVHEIKQTVTGVPDTVITKTITLGMMPPTFTLEFTGRRTRRWSANDLVIQMMGLMIESLSFNSTPGDEPLKITFGVKGISSRDATSAGADLVAGSSKVEVGFDKGSYLPTGSYITVDSIKYRVQEALTIDINRNVEVSPVHNEGTRPYYLNGDPYEHWPGVVETVFSVLIPMRNKNMYNHVKNADSVDCAIVYERPGTGDQLTVTVKNVTFTTPGIEIPEQGKYPQNMEGKGLYPEIEVKDFIPYYVL